MRKLGLVGSLLVVSAGWHALGACTGDEPVAGVLDAGNKDGALPEAAPPGEGGVGSPKLAAGVPRAMLRQGGTVEIALTLTRDGLEGDVAVSVTGLPKGVTAEPAAFAGTSTAAKLVLKAAADATLGDASLTLEAKGAPGLPFPLLVAGASGTLDTTFDTDGEVLFPKNGPEPNAVVVQPDGKLVVVGGGIGITGLPWFLHRINLDGSRDAAFETAVAPLIPSRGEAFGVALEPGSGKFVVTGISEGRFTLIRALPTGAPDISFAKNGAYRADAFSDPPGSSGEAVFVLANGDFFAAGSRSPNTGEVGFVERFLQNGARDLRFPTYLTSSPAHFRGVFQQPDGTVVAVGDDTTQHIAVRFLPSGALDTTFGTGGLRTYGGGCISEESALAPNGDVILVGREVPTGPVPRTCITRIAAREKGEARYSLKGRGARYPNTAVGTAGELMYVSSTAAGPDEAWITTIERYLPDGKLDATFAKGGVLQFDAVVGGTSIPTIRALATLPDGRLIVAGTNLGSPFVARYWP
jgi:uncharacterized delta-60 repeat protein